MAERELFGTLLWGWLVLAALVFPLLFFITAPYGRHNREGWGPQLGRRVGWVVMEAPSPLLMALFFAVGQRHGSAVAAVFLAMWLLHYVNRAFIYPFRVRGGQKRMPLLIVLFALFFNLGNAYFNGRHLFAFAPEYPLSWLLDPRFLGGSALFLAGFLINLHADGVLLRMRAHPAADGYRIPRGGLYELVSCPNYLGEVMEWSGWALATWSLAGLSFALWTVANLVPRALSNHRWYRERFPDYPARRRAVIPFLL
jgi:protein-S-isoprenylcysteine O-methyltransferase Ste14